MDRLARKGGQVARGRDPSCVAIPNGEQVIAGTLVPHFVVDSSVVLKWFVEDDESDYDSYCLASAIEPGGVLVTADALFVRKVGRHPNLMALRQIHLPE